MRMNELEQAAKREIQNILNKQGYPTYSRLLDKLDVKLINTEKNPEAVAYLDTSTATIYLNPNLNIKQVSTIVRHEILHEYLTHVMREEKFRQRDPKYKNIPHQLANIAADYEISNKGYTDADKDIARSIILNDKVLQGLVTEDQHEDWIDKSFEEMLELLIQENKDNMQNMMSDIGIEPPEPEDLDDIQNQSQQAQNAGKDIEKQGNTEADSQKQQSGQDIQDKAKEIGDEAKDLKDEADKSNSKNNVFRTPAQQAIDAENQKRAAELKKALDELREQIFEETEEQKDIERVAKKAKDVKKYKESPISRFTDSLNNFIKNELAIGRGKTWTRMNKKYVGSGLIKAGSSRLASNYVPLINVYFDRSGSWDNPEKTKLGQQSIATLNKYVTRGELKINLYYFSENVHSNEQQALAEGGTYGQPILDHIKATKPDNVIILTDGDITDCRSNITVPGGVWMLFYGERSENLIDHLHGRKLTKYFDVEVM